MNHGKYDFAQLFEFVSRNDFLKCVNKYNGDYKRRYFIIILQKFIGTAGWPDKIVAIRQLSDLWVKAGDYFIPFGREDRRCLDFFIRS